MIIDGIWRETPSHRGIPIAEAPCWAAERHRGAPLHSERNAALGAGVLGLENPLEMWQIYRKNIGKSWENHRTHIGTSWENHRKNMGKSWENHRTIIKTH